MTGPDASPPHGGDDLPGAPDQALDEQLAALVSQALDGVPVTPELRTRILMPTAERLAVRLVPLDTVERLQQSDSDKSIWDSAMWAGIGAAGGYAATLPSSDQPPDALNIVILAVLTAATGGFVALRIRFGRRSKNIRASFYEGQGPSTNDS